MSFTDPIIYDFPEELALFTDSRFFLKSVNFTSQSMFTKQRNIYGAVNQMWVVQVTLSQLSYQNGRVLGAFLSLLEGGKNFVRLGDAARKYPLGVGAGAYGIEADSVKQPWSDSTYFGDGTGWVDNPIPTSSGLTYCRVGENGLRGNKSIVLSGLVASQPIALMAGDLLQIGNWLYEVSTNTQSDADGNARAEIRPRLREGVAVGDIVRLHNAKGVFQLADSDQGGIDYSGRLYGGTLSLSFVERII